MNSWFVVGSLVFVLVFLTARSHGSRSVNRDREISRECTRLSERRSVDDACHTFNECCRERCRRYGGRGKHVCDYDDIYGERICRCEGIRGRSRNRDRDYSDSDSEYGRDRYEENRRDRERGGGRRGEYERRRSVSHQCRSNVERNSYSTRERCSEFRRCCNRECRRSGTTRCDRFDFMDATCHCAL